jgi:hypothetical protein
MHPIIAEAFVRNYQSSRIDYAQHHQRSRTLLAAPSPELSPRRRRFRSSGVRNRRYRLV